MNSGALRLQLYVLWRVLAGVAGALALIAAVILLINFVEISRTLGGRVELSFAEVMGLTLLKSPSVVLLILPFAFLFGVMASFVALNRRGELVALRAAGVSAWRFTAPPAAAAFLIGIVAVGWINPLATRLNAAFEDRRDQITLGRDRAAGRELWLRQGDDKQQVVIHARAHDTIDGVVRLRGVSLFIQAVDRGRAPAFSRRIEAEEARLMPGFWRLTQVTESLPGAASVHSEQISVPSMLDHRSAMERFVPPGDVAFSHLPATIRSAELAGYASTSYRIRYQQLLATPLLLAAMSLLAAAFSLRLARLGDLARMVGAGVALGFIAFFLNQFCGALGGAEFIPAYLAAWAPPVLVLLAGLTLLCYTEDG